MIRLADRWSGSEGGEGFSERLELLTYDWRVRVAFRHPGPVATNLAAVFVDDDDLKLVNEALGFHWPWPRALFARVIRELAAEQVGRVACDVFFLDRQRDPAGAGQATSAVPTYQSDRFLGQALAAAGNVSLGCPGEVSEGQWRVLPTIPLLHTNALALGYASADRDADGTPRLARPFRDAPEPGRIWDLNLSTHPDSYYRD